jgi:hypothetical protein
MITDQEIDALPDPQPQPALTDADARGCRHISGEPTPIRSGLWCGAPCLRDSSYCEEHHFVCWTVPKRRRKQMGPQPGPELVAPELGSAPWPG